MLVRVVVRSRLLPPMAVLFLVPVTFVGMLLVFMALVAAIFLVPVAFVGMLLVCMALVAVILMAMPSVILVRVVVVRVPAFLAALVVT